MNLRPLDNRVVLKPIEEDNKSAGGIVIPDTAKKAPTRGTVEAVGPGRLLKDGTRAPVQLKTGDIVWFEKYAGADVEIDRVMYKILEETEIFAVES
jgi:chaperonin GroES